MSRRVHYIDWLRVAAVLLLFPFHAGRVFDAGDPFYAKSPIDSIGISMVIAFIDAWHMPLLFLLAGASTYFAMSHRSVSQYMRERSLRLLVPLIFGILVIVPPQTWYGARTNDGYTGTLLDYITSGRWLQVENLLGRGDYFGGLSPAHLWFILYLWMLSIAAVPLLGWGRSSRGAQALSRAARGLSRPWWWLSVVFVILIAEAMPDVAGKNPFYYFAYFIAGYVTMHDEAFAVATERWRIPALAAGIAINIGSMVFREFGRALPDPSFPRAMWTYAVLGGSWLTVIGLLGFGRRYLDTHSTTLAYLGQASYPLYILHQTVIVAIAFYLVQLVPHPAIGWPLLMVVATLTTLGLYEVVRRVPALRFLMGMKPATNLRGPQ